MKFTLDDKRQILRSFIALFEKEAATLDESAKAAHEAATHEESKAEDQHDTRGIEASYLAGAQSARVEELKLMIFEYKSLLDAQTKSMNQVQVGALVRIQMLTGEGGKPKGAPIQALYAPKGGGSTIESPKGTISVITPNSPLGEILFELEAGSEVTLESKAGDRHYRIESVS